MGQTCFPEASCTDPLFEETGLFKTDVGKKAIRLGVLKNSCRTDRAKTPPKGFLHRPPFCRHRFVPNRCRQQSDQARGPNKKTAFGPIGPKPSPRAPLRPAICPKMVVLGHPLFEAFHILIYEKEVLQPQVKYFTTKKYFKGA